MNSLPSPHSLSMTLYQRYIQIEQTIKSMTGLQCYARRDIPTNSLLELHFTNGITIGGISFTETTPISSVLTELQQDFPELFI